MYPWLTQPDTQESRGTYHTKLIVPGDKAQEHIKTINDVIAKEIASNTQMSQIIKRQLKGPHFLMRN